VRISFICPLFSGLRYVVLFGDGICAVLSLYEVEAVVKVIVLAFLGVLAMADELTVQIRSASEHPVAVAGAGFASPYLNADCTWVRIFGGDPMTAGYRLTFERKDGTRLVHVITYRMPAFMATEALVPVARKDLDAVTVEEMKPLPAKRVQVE
jgi:hypothetical protein